VSLSAGFSETDEGLVGDPASTAWDAGLRARQTVFNAAVRAGVRASVAAREAAVADFEASVQAALLGVRERFYDVLLARTQITVQEQAVALLGEELANARKRVEAGSGSPFEQLRAEVSLANRQPALIRARNQYRLAAVELFRAIGLPAAEGVEDSLVGALGFAPREAALGALLDAGRAKRPELRQLEKLVALREAGLQAARAGSMPSVDAFAGWGIQKSPASNDLDDTVDGWTVGVQGSWAVFDGRATKGRVAQARAQLAQAKLAWDETALAIDAGIRQAWSSYREAAELVTASQKVVEQAREALRLARSRFDVGAATQLDVLQAQVALTEAQTNEAVALHGAAVSWARLERAASLAPLPAGAELKNGG
jgi:outer membrane protein TolC